MTSTSYLTLQSLFVDLPVDTDRETDSFFDEEYVASAQYSDLIDTTYQLITTGGIELEKDILILWEMRLTLLLFDGRLSTAKLEAVNLNNALFFHENPTSSSTGRPGAIVEGPSPAANFPLPKNNAGLISYLLLMLVLRLKSAPNLALVNELYKLCYQVRLKGVPVESMMVQKKLFNLSYEIISILVTARHHLTLLSFLQSLKRDSRLRIVSSCENGQLYDTFLSNISIIWIYAQLVIRRGKGTDENLSEYGLRFEKEWSSIKESTKKAFIEAVSLFSPSEKHPLIGLDPLTFLVTEFADLVSSDIISTRIISSTLAAWDLLNSPFSRPSSNKEVSVVEGEKHSTSLEKVYAALMEKWPQYADKVYGME